MSDMNRISATLSNADITAINNAIQVLHDKLPFLIGLSDADRETMPKMSDKSEGFHEKTKGYMKSNPECTPAFVEAAEVAKDQGLRDQMASFFRP